MRIRVSGLCAAALITFAAALPAAAQQTSDACAEGAKLMQQRQGMVQHLQARAKGKKMNPVEACGKFNNLVANGQKLVAWMEASGAWCSVPDTIIANVKEDQQRSVNIRGQACGAAAKYKQMMARAKAQARAAAQQGQGSGRLGGSGGDIVSGQMRVPSGAL